jgi:hypothetical protein
MAGQGKTQAKIKDLERQLAEMEEEKRELAEALAVHAPHVILKQAPKPQKHYDPEMCDKVVALGSQGFSEASIIASLGASGSDWDEWKGTFPDLAAAVSRAKAAALAWVDNAQREAMAKGDWRFPFQTAQRVRENLQKQSTSAGSASAFVSIKRGTTCTKCGAGV